MKFITSFGAKLHGNIKIPGDKSISHRALILGSIAEGTTNISGFLEGDDVLATLNAFKAMGVDIQRDNDKVTIKGVGLRGLKKPSAPLNLGNSGTAVRLISGVLAGQDFAATLIGDMSLSKRPMNRIIKPLTQMGADISGNNNQLPLNIIGKCQLTAINYEMPVASAQVKSCILLAGLYASDKSCVIEPEVTRDHSERMLKAFGVRIVNDGDNICLYPGKLSAIDVIVPSDISSAAFFIVAATIAKNSSIILQQVNINPTRTGIIDILKLMGANIAISNITEIGGEMLADISIKSAKLKAIDVPTNLVAIAIDEFPVIFIAMSVAEGVSTLTGAKELRFKESDRIQVMADGLRILGIDATVLDDGIKITGGQFKKPTQAISSYDDHRISMAFAIASVACPYDITINDTANVSTSFPNFVELANTVGMNIKEL